MEGSYRLLAGVTDGNMAYFGKSINGCPLTTLLEHPIMVIEEAAPSYYTWSGRKQFEHKRLPQARDRAPQLVKIHLLLPNPEQIYVAKRLDCPHYQIGADDLIDFLLCCEELGVLVEYACPWTSSLHPDNFLSYVNSGTVEYSEEVRRIVAGQINHKKVYGDLKARKAKKDSERGNVQLSTRIAWTTF